MNGTEQNGTVPVPLSRRQQRAIAAILDTANMEDAARRARVGRTTLYTWLREPAFRDELTRRQADIFDAALARLKCLVGDAVNGLGDLIGATSENVRRSACRDIVDIALKVREMRDIEDRLTQLERAVQEGRGR